MRATLTGDGRGAAGELGRHVPGTLSVEVRNETSGLGDFDLMHLPEGTNLKGIERWFSKARQELRADGQQVGTHQVGVSTLVAPLEASVVDLATIREATR